MALLTSLGIDTWGILLYLVNFGVIFFMLKKYLFTPLLKYLDERREIVRQSLAAAEAARAELEEMQAMHDKQIKEKLAEMEAQVHTIRTTAAEQATRLIQEAEERRDRMVQEARQLIESAKRGMVQEVEAEILQRVERAIVAVLGKKVDATEVKKSVSEAWHDATK